MLYVTASSGVLMRCPQSALTNGVPILLHLLAAGDAAPLTDCDDAQRPADSRAHRHPHRQRREVRACKGSRAQPLKRCFSRQNAADGALAALDSVNILANILPGNEGASVYVQLGACQVPLNRPRRPLGLPATAAVLAMTQASCCAAAWLSFAAA